MQAVWKKRIALQDTQKLRHYKFITTTYCIICKNIITRYGSINEEGLKWTFFTFLKPLCLFCIMITINFQSNLR